LRHNCVGLLLAAKRLLRHTRQQQTYRERHLDELRAAAGVSSHGCSRLPIRIGPWHGGEVSPSMLSQGLATCPDGSLRAAEAPRRHPGRVEPFAT
jgi:hypothetical protein